MGDGALVGVMAGLKKDTGNGCRESLHEDIDYDPDASASTGVAGGSIGQGLHQCCRDGLGQDLGLYAPVYRAH